MLSLFTLFDLIKISLESESKTGFPINSSYNSSKDKLNTLFYPLSSFNSFLTLLNSVIKKALIEDSVVELNRNKPSLKCINLNLGFKIILIK